MKLKLLIIGPGMNNVKIPPIGWGGIEKVIWKHACELGKMGVEGDIYNGRNEQELLELIRKNRYDIIHVHQEWAYFTLQKYAIPFAFTSHDSNWRERWNVLGNMFELCALPMPFEPMGVRVKSDEQWIICNGADDALFTVKAKKKNSCIAIGKNEPRKRFAFIVDLIMHRPEFHLTLMGPECHIFKDVAPNITVRNNHTESVVADFMNQSEYLFHLSEKEADCLVVKEGAMSGCKLILSNYCASVIGNDISYTDPYHFDSCPEDLGIRARERALARYTWRTIGEDILSGYDKYLSNHGSMTKLIRL